jgi:PAS domain S-box-containing protein
VNGKRIIGPGIEAQRYLAPIVTILAGTIISFIGFTLALSLDRQMIRTEFEKGAENRFETIKREIESNLHAVVSVKAFFDSTLDVNRSEFRDFVGPHLLLLPSIQAIEWIPCVHHFERMAHEAAARKNGLSDFQITERETQGKMVRAAEREEYFPVYFVEPYKGNEIALGFDLASNAMRKEALKKSRDTGEMVATGRITLVQETAGQFGFLVFAPVYRRDVTLDSIKGRRENLKGFALGVFRIGDIVEKSLKHLEPEAIDIYLYDKSADSQEESFLYFHPSRPRKTPFSSMPKGEGGPDGRLDLQNVKTFDIANREWLIVLKAAPDFVSVRKTWQPWGVLTAGLLLTAILASYLIVHKRVAEGLRESEEKFITLVNNAPDAIYVGTRGCFAYVNEAALRLFGATLQEQLLDRPVMDRIHPDFHASVLERIRLLDEEKIPVPTVEEKCVRLDGTSVDVEVSAIPFNYAQHDGALVFVRDITERKQAEEELRESRQQLSDIIDFLPDATFVIDKEGKVIAWNRAIEEMTGIRAADMLGKGNYEYALPFWGERRPILIDLVLESRQKIERRYAALARAGWAIAGEAYMPALGGGKVYLLGTASALFDSRGNVVGAIESIRDITERKLAEEALKRANILLFTQKETSIDGILAVNENDTIILSNDRFADMWGISREAVGAQVDAPVLQEVSDRVRDPQAFLQRIDHLCAHRNETSLEEIALKDGRTFERYSAPMNGTDGRYYGRVWYFRDITERKRMEEAVAEAEAKYRGIFENSVMGIFQTTPEGRFISLNMAAAHILGYDSPEEVLNTVGDISRQLYVNPDRRSELLRLIEERGMAQEFEVQFFRKDSSVAWMTLNVRAVRDVNGKIIRMDGTAEDITESKRLASQLNQAQKMEAIGTLAGGIAHDFNNILMPIIGYSELSLNEVPKGSRLHHNIEQILLSGNRARELVKQILTFSRKTEQELRPVQVSLLVKETLKLLRSSLPSTIQIRQDIDEGAIDATTMADPTQIHQVLMNLCTNAAHAMREKAGVLSITLKIVDIDSVAISEVQDLAPGSYLRLSVADTGHGMDEALRQRIFDPYFTTKGPSEGTGLGLALIYGIVKNLSGGIAVFSEPGKGATFDVYFPRTKTLQAPTVEAPELLPTGKGLVLVVDDEQLIVDMLKEMLGSLGYDVAARYSSYDALEAFRARPDSFDLVITDLTMPHMTGIDLAREILKIRSDTPIILCTGFSEAVNENRTKLLGIKGFLMKPLALRDLAETVNKILFQDKLII